MITLQSLRPLVFVTILAVSGGALSACNHDDGPAEQLGEKIDETIEKAGDAVEDAGNR